MKLILEFMSKSRMQFYHQLRIRGSFDLFQLDLVQKLYETRVQNMRNNSHQDNNLNKLQYIFSSTDDNNN